MSSTYSPNLRIELIGTGDQAGNWGTTTNTNLGTLIEDGISGYVAVSVTAANQAFSANNGTADQARNATIRLTTTTGANFAVYAPPAEKQYVIYNASSYTATVYNSTVLGNTTAAGAGVAVPAGKTVTMWSDGTNFYFQNSHLSSLTLSTDLAVADGGTGASDAATARTNLGLGTISTQASNSVSITGGSISGITDLAVADGGTGASDAATARTNLGLAIGTNVQAYDADLTAIAGLSNTDGNFIVGNGSTWVAESGSTARTSLGLTIGTDVQAYDADLSAIAGLSNADGNIIVGDGTTWVAESGSTARTSLGLGTIATQNSSNVSITGGSISGITDLALADGGTGASTASGARTNLGLIIGTDVQAYDADLTTLGGLAKTDGNFIVGNGTTWVAESGSTARTSLGLGTIATQNSNNVSITGGDATGLTSFGTTGFTVTQSGTKLVISYGATEIFSISSTGVITALSNVVSNGTP